MSPARGDAAVSLTMVGDRVCRWGICRCMASRSTLALMLCLCIACGHGPKEPPAALTAAPPRTAEATIVQSWHADYPVSQLGRLPVDQRDTAVGVIVTAADVSHFWPAFQPGKPIPAVDFNTHLLLFARNTQFYNRIRIGRVTVTGGVAEVLAMETMSALPIDDRVAMSVVLVPRAGIRAIRNGGGTRPIE